MKNKILSLTFLLIAVVIVAASFSFHALAAEYVDPTIAVECTDISAEGLEDNQFRADIVVYNNPGISGYYYALRFDNSKIRIVDVVREYDEYDEEMYIVSAFPIRPTINIDEPGFDLADCSEIRAYASRANRSPKNGVYLSVIFEIISVFDETAICIEDEQFVNAYREDVSFAVLNDTVGIMPYSISYNANGGIGAPASQTKRYGESLTLSSTVPTRTGYTFMGWATSTYGSVAYMPGASFTANADTTLYAVWKANTYTGSGA